MRLERLQLASLHHAYVRAVPTTRASILPRLVGFGRLLCGRTELC